MCVCVLVDVNAVDMYGVAAMHLAAENGHTRCLTELLEAGALCNVGTAEKRPQWVTTTGRHCVTCVRCGSTKLVVVDCSTHTVFCKNPHIMFFHISWHFKNHMSRNCTACSVIP